VINWKK